MFLDKVVRRNPSLVETAVKLHQEKKILPDTFVIDVDTLLNNAKVILDEANKHQMDMYFMLKQLGRNPYLAKRLVELGYKGAVVVDFKEAQVMMKHHIPISNVGHLVQPPMALLQQLVDYGCEYFTVYSLDKIQQINECATKANKVQKIFLRVYDDNDMIYSGQTAGFKLACLQEIITKCKEYKNIQIGGVTSFPCFLYDEQLKAINKMPNMDTVLKAVEICKENGIENLNINSPSTTCTKTIELMAKVGAKSGEPGHGLSGTTPLHAHEDCPEVPCVIYLSEISHNFEGHGYCYGGGFYRRGHIENALVGNDPKALTKMKVILPSLESIDYHFGLENECKVNDSVVMSFRFQIFVTRSDVCLIEGLSTNTPKIVGVYSSLGEQK